MASRAIAFILSMALSATAQAQEWLYASNAMLIADWAQTRYIARNPQRYFEFNPILGRHPTVGKVNTYFAGALIGNYFLYKAFGDKWAIGVTIVEGATVAHNYGIGIRMDF